jgi:hypothetical protein
MVPKLVSISFLIALIIQSVKGAVKIASFNQWCMPAGNPNMESVSMKTGTSANQIPPYDFVLFYSNVNNESVQLLISIQAPGVEDWKAYWVDKTGKWTMMPLVGTKFHSYVNLVNNFLFTSFGQNYYVYKIIETDTTVSPSTF